MQAFLSILAFIAMGVVMGLLVAYRHKGSSQLANVLVGIGGALGASWLAGLLGIGRGIAPLSLWGGIFGLLGAWLLPLLVRWIQKKTAHA